MKVFLATDHVGFELKEKTKEFLKSEGYEVEDCGAFQYDKYDDYPDFISKAAEGVSKDPINNKGIIFGGSGQAECMTANKFKGVRCALFYAPAVPARAADITGRQSTDPFEMIRLTREHNDANMLSIGVRFLTDEDALKVVKMWLETPFPGDERHLRRIEKIRKIEESL
jgi:ribose 5-phosphate isomerase B